VVSLVGEGKADSAPETRRTLPVAVDVRRLNHLN